MVSIEHEELSINCIRSDVIPNHKILKLILHLFLRVLNCLKNVSQTNNCLFDTDKLLKSNFCLQPDQETRMSRHVRLT